ncbi:polyamine aminopropyltransferase [Aureivirga marina]|uniref:polyamine aminopropyltransferase n=1 Tax=Aureivirga marina TaxID=1182451 RepID=UPI0018CABFA1|nr:polyamine aminopropyltransferase [Aureivirga marina]
MVYLNSLKKKSTLLKMAIFATGFAGIVAEYTLSTLASYFLGNSVFQFTMIVSLMLFFMGIGSRISKKINGNLINKFLYLELILSVLVSISSVLVYTIAAFTDYYGIVIYLLCIAVGLLIGIEIPIVVRINEEYEELKSNISSVLEKDYYGSLLGGVFFGFVGLPILGLTYTPYILGFVNFAVALLLFFSLKNNLEKKRLIQVLFIGVFAFIGFGAYTASPIIQWGEQQKYADKIIYSEQTKYQKIVMTQWQDYYWLYLNNNLQFSSQDEPMYHEPLVHPAMQLHPNPKNILVLGGGDGCAARELLKYDSVETIDLVDLDPKMTELAMNHPVLTKINNNSFHHEKVNVQNTDAYLYIEKNKDKFYDIIIIDLPDPRSVDLGRMYSYEFYSNCYRKLRPNGVIITQAGSPYYATKSFLSIEKTMKAAKFKVAPMHNQVLTMGEWGWILGIKTNEDISVKNTLRNLTFENVETRWINHDAMQLMTSFGKNFFISEKDSIEINKVHNPVVHRYYNKGNWDIY